RRFGHASVNVFCPAFVPQFTKRENDSEVFRLTPRPRLGGRVISAILSRCKSFTRLQEWSLYRKKQQSRRGVDAEFDSDYSGCGCERDAMAVAELRDAVDHEFLNEIGAVSDAGDERCAGNSDSPEKQSRTDSANQQCRHADCDQWKLPHARSDSHLIAFAQPQRATDQCECRQP